MCRDNKHQAKTKLFSEMKKLLGSILHFDAVDVAVLDSKTPVDRLQPEMVKTQRAFLCCWEVVQR